MQRTLLIAAAALALSACQPPQSAGRAVELYAMECGTATFTNIDMFADDGSMAGLERTLVDPCFLIRHPQGDLIWDTGFSDALAAQAGGMQIDAIGAHAAMPHTLASQLQQLNLTPADIEFVSFSHMHSDHTGNGNLFAGSTWIVDADERAAMFSAEGRADAQGFAGYSQLENAETRLIEANEARHDVFGDGSVVIIQAPGHTPGHSLLLVRLANAGPVLLTGDMYHLSESRQRRLVPRFNFDRAQTLASMDLVDTIEREENARVIRQHVQEDFDSLPAFPAALN